MNKNEGLDIASRDIFYRTFATLYPSIHSPKGAVVYIDEESLGPSRFWPMPYGRHSAAFDAMRRHNPAALFTDVTFIQLTDDPKGLADMIGALRRLKADGTSLFLTSDATTAGTPSLRPELLALAREGIVTLVSAADMRSTPYDLNYSLHPDKAGLDAPALAIYKDYCQRRSNNECSKLSGISQFEVWWGARKTAVNCAPTTDTTCHQVSAPWLRFARLAWNSTFSHLQLPELDPIPDSYHPTIKLSNLLDGIATDLDKENIQGATVFYTPKLNLLHNPVYTAVYGTNERRELLAVHYHAMAFDNLVALKHRLISNAPIDHLTATQTTAALIFLAYCMVLLAHAIFSVVGLSQPSRGFDAFIYICSLLALSFGAFLVIQMSPKYWMAAALAGTPWLLVDVTKYTHEKWMLFFHRRPRR
ncbi:MAG: CHASE2 domain-containing protein [Hyphomicrobiaceae bacterium]|nr:CHASE2 domain-containing protein [Hyphomicrobiaceae bacterium]